MKFGFIIDNRKCIGCHACTVACKSEHEVPVGVNRTWVKQVEKGTFPSTRRLFSVMRCNHCTDAPCVDICPVEALYTRPDGIVDFDKDRCIGCKSCMQACPYDALYIDPENSTAAKCNYCAHRVDIGLEPACVNVCPEHAIISGDMENPDTEIAMLLGTQQVTVRKEAKGTQPNVFYIDGDEASLNPVSAEPATEYLWGAQQRGVGHFARKASDMAFSNGDLVQAVLEARNQGVDAGQLSKTGPQRSAEILLGKSRQVYNTPDKGILWGWEVSAYVLSKALAAGAFLIPFLAWLLDYEAPALWLSIGLSVLFLGLTGIFLIKDLDRPDRFLYVFLRGRWGSWLVRGAYAIAVYGALLTLLFVNDFWSLGLPALPLMALTAIGALLVAGYTAFLFAQAKGRDFWQSPMLVVHMLVHAFMGGAALFGVLSPWLSGGADWLSLLRYTLLASIWLGLLTLLFELSVQHPTEEARRTVKLILSGSYRRLFWLGVVLVGNAVPLLLLWLGGNDTPVLLLSSVLVLIGMYLTEKIWVEAPQRIPLS